MESVDAVNPSENDDDSELSGPAISGRKRAAEPCIVISKLATTEGDIAIDGLVQIRRASVTYSRVESSNILLAGVAVPDTKTYSLTSR